MSSIYKPSYIEDIEAIPCGKLVIQAHRNGSKTAYLHYVDGMNVYHFCPDLWHGWKIVQKFVGEREVY